MKKNILLISTVLCIIVNIYSTIHLSSIYFLSSYILTGVVLFIFFSELISNDDVDIFIELDEQNIWEMAKELTNEERIISNNNDVNFWEERELFWHLWLETKLYNNGK